MPGEDSELVEGCLRREEQAFRALLEKYRARVYSTVLRIVSNEEDARDIAQETFVRVFKSISQFDTSKPFPNWLFRIAVNLSIDLVRRRKFAFFPLSSRSEEGEKEYDVKDLSHTPEADYERKASGERFESLIEAVPMKYRTALLLRYKEEFSYDEIAGILGVPIGTIKARLHRGHKMLRKKLEAGRLRANAGLRARVVF